jgi:hypothetical protein
MNRETLEKEVLQLINEDFKKDIRVDLKDILNLPIILEKYLNIHFQLMMEINKSEAKKNEIFSERFQYYKEGYSVMLNPSEIKTYLDGDKEVLTAKEDLSYLESLFKQVCEMIQELRSLQYMLKTKLEYEKLICGR